MISALFDVCFIATAAESRLGSSAVESESKTFREITVALFVRFMPCHRAMCFSSVVGGTGATRPLA